MKTRQILQAVLHEETVRLGSNYNTRVNVSVLQDLNDLDFPMISVELGINTALDADSSNTFTLYSISKKDLATIGLMLIKASECIKDDTQ